jgi:hypothetical protein
VGAAPSGERRAPPRMIDTVEAHIWRLRSEGVAFLSRLYLGRGASVALPKEGQT